MADATGAVADRKIAVMFVHGVEIRDPHFAKNATAMLKAAFTRHAGRAADDVLVIKPVYWAEDVEEIEDKLYRACFGAPARKFFSMLSGWATRIDAGHSLAVIPMLLAGAMRILPVPGARFPNYPMLRWVVTQYVGDAIAYQQSVNDRELYDRIHARFAEVMHDLAEEAGTDAPLCVISHSLGTVISSNYLYDLQVQHGGNGRRLIAPAVEERIGSTPLEQGRTLALFYTLGSPIPLWTMRFADFGRPLTVPSPLLEAHHPGMSGEWVNFYDPDDLVAHPLCGLSERYREQVTEDRKVSVGPWWLGWTPFSHFSYWNDNAVIDPIARSLARSWRELRHERGAGAGSARAGTGARVASPRRR